MLRPLNPDGKPKREGQLSEGDRRMIDRSRERGNAPRSERERQRTRERSR